jgi:hypothetical protein
MPIVKENRMSKNEGRKRREAFRQDEVLAMKEELLTPEQFSAEMNKTGIVSQHASLMQEMVNHDAGPARYGSTLSPEITGALEALEQKLNYLITLQMENDDDTEYDQRLVNLSSTGIGFSTQEKCNKGDWLKIKLKLPLFPPVKLELLGEAVSVFHESGKRSGTRIGVSFLYRCEQEEDAIIKYLFKRQRERIRAKYTRKSLGKESDEEIEPGI